MSEWLCWVSPCDLYMHIYEPTNALDFNSETLKCWNMEKVDPEMLQLLVLPKWWSFVGHFPAFEGHFSQMTHKCFDKWPRNVYQKFKCESRISPTSPLNLMKARILPYKDVFFLSWHFFGRFSDWKILWKSFFWSPACISWNTRSIFSHSMPRPLREPMHFTFLMSGLFLSRYGLI